MSAPHDEKKGAFRSRLDAVLRQRDPQALRAFLVEAGQWEEGATPTDLPAAMWMMIAGSRGLRELHAEAERWLRAHGRETEAGILADHPTSAQGGSGVGERSNDDRRHRYPQRPADPGARSNPGASRGAPRRRP